MTVSRLPVPDSFGKRPGCSDRCRVLHALVSGESFRRWIEWHDVEAHEAYMRDASESHVVGVGPLMLDRRLHIVDVGGVPVHLSHNECSLLAALIERPDDLRSYQSLMSAVWGSVEYTSHHVLVLAQRLRRRLGTYRWMIRTYVGAGLMLVTEPPEPVRSVPPLARRVHPPDPSRGRRESLGPRARAILTFLERTQGRRGTLARAAVEVYGRNTAKIRANLRASAAGITLPDLAVLSDVGAPPGYGWIWIEDREPEP